MTFNTKTHMVFWVYNWHYIIGVDEHHYAIYWYKKYKQPSRLYVNWDVLTSVKSNRVLGENVLVQIVTGYIVFQPEHSRRMELF